jgi:hypothetical protein
LGKTFGYCGLPCRGCPSYLATKKKDKKVQYKMRIEILRILREAYGIDYGLEKITDCNG